MRIFTATLLLGAYWWLGVCSVHDQLRMQEAVWSSAEDLLRSGIPLFEIDAGQQWGGWHLYEFARANPAAHRRVSSEEDGWFIAFYLPVIDRKYAIFAPSEEVGAVRAGSYNAVSWKKWKKLCGADGTVNVGMRVETLAD